MKSKEQIEKMAKEEYPDPIPYNAGYDIAADLKRSGYVEGYLACQSDAVPQSDAVEWDKFDEWLGKTCGHILNKSIKSMCRINWNAPTKKEKNERRN